MSNCNECVCEQVCKYNNEKNEYCKGNCPHFASKDYFAESTYKFGDTIFAVNYLPEIEKHNIVYFSIYKYGIKIGVEGNRDFTSDRVFASKDKAEEFLKTLNKTNSKGV